MNVAADIPAKPLPITIAFFTLENNQKINR
jgi:hypothetical protein